MNEFVKQYSEAMKVVMQQTASRLGGVPAAVKCYCMSHPPAGIAGACPSCCYTGRIPIPWAEVMNVR